MIQDFYAFFVKCVDLAPAMVVAEKKQYGRPNRNQK
jgi:hypothetical protein